MTSPTPTQTVDDIRAGLEGVTPGEWTVAEEGTYPDGEGSKVIGPQQWNSRGHPVRYYVAQYVTKPDAAHIARCSPARLLPVLYEFDRMRERIAALEAERDRIEAARADLWRECRELRSSIDVEKAVADSCRIERDEARKVLEPFAKVAALFNDTPPIGSDDTLHSWETINGSAALTMTDCAAARAFLAKEK